MKLRELRKARNLHQSDIASVLGVTVSTVSAWENEIYEVDFKHLIQLADFFDVTVDELLGRADPTILDSDHRDVIQCYDRLTPQQQDIIMQCMQCFISGNVERKKQDYDP